MNLKFSIVIPAYNVEDYMDDCLLSCLKQSYENIEIIVVDDCSTDGTLERIKYWQKKDRRIKLIENKKNIGLGMVRNLAMKKITGDYFLFLDGDDFFSTKACEVLYDKIQENKDIDIFFFDFEYYSNLGNSYFKSPGYITNQKYPGKHTNSEFLKIKEIYHAISAWIKCYSFRFYKQYEIQFSKHNFAEDITFFYKIINKASLIYILKDALLFYRKRETVSSLSTTDRISSPPFMLDLIDIFSNLFDRGYINKYNLWVVLRQLYYIAKKRQRKILFNKEIEHRLDDYMGRIKSKFSKEDVDLLYLPEDVFKVFRWK